MHRKLLMLAGWTLATWTTGCCMCDAPYDYCGPRFTGGPCDECVTDARMNSVFDPYPGPTGGESYPEGAINYEMPTPAGDAAPAPPPTPDIYLP